MGVIAEIRVAKVRDWQPDGSYAAYIGRGSRGRKGSPLGNPFQIGRDGDRDEVIAKYATWLDEEIATNDEQHMTQACWAFNDLLIRHRQGEAITLLCWCHPLGCHGDVIRERLLSKAGVR